MKPAKQELTDAYKQIAEQKGQIEAMLKIVIGIYECPFIYTGSEMENCCEGCTEQEPNEEQEMQCWKEWINSNNNR